MCGCTCIRVSVCVSWFACGEGDMGEKYSGCLRGNEQEAGLSRGGSWKGGGLLSQRGSCVSLANVSLSAPKCLVEPELNGHDRGRRGGRGGQGVEEEVVDGWGW